jgi:penicillin-binding protein 2
VASGDVLRQTERSRRAWQLVAIVGLGAIVLAIRLFGLQVLGVDDYTLQSERNRIRREWVRAPRGLILDRDDRVLADSRPSYAVLAVPRDLLRDEAGLALLSELLEMDREKFVERLSTGPRHLPRVVRHDASFEQVSRVAEREQELAGVSLEVTNVRTYPYGSLAAHLLGHVGEISESEVKEKGHEGYRPGDFLGRLGLERKYEKELRGKDGERYLEVDVVGRVVGEFQGRDPVPPVPGRTLRLHLDTRLQAIAESTLVGRRGAVCMIDVATGGVRVFAAAPTFDPNLFSTGIRAADWNVLNGDPERPLLNRVVQAQYAPGSIFKMISMAMALEENLAGYNELLPSSCTGGYRFGNRVFRCWEEEGHGRLAMEGGLIHSCDVYFYQIAERCQMEQLAHQSRAAGLGEPTGIDLPQELKGLVPTPAWMNERYGVRGWTRGALLNQIIGQGEYLVTPLQMAVYANTLATSGVKMVPHLVASVEDPDGTVQNVSSQVRGRWDLPERTMERLREAMRLVVADDEGTGRVARVQGFMPAAKTGTAENPHGKPHSWFIGYAPADAPEVAFAVVVEAGGHGSDVAAPIAKRLLKELAPPPPPPTPIKEDAS